MKLWKKISDNRYELFLKESSDGRWDAVLYIENDRTINFSYGFNGKQCSHKPISTTNVMKAKKEIEKVLFDETIETLNTYQKICKQRIDALSE